jgi:hypothetical protein
MRSSSGRIVADINPEVKRALHAALVASGKTLKEWLVERALAEIEQHANARASVAYQTVGRSREAPLFGEAAVTTIGGTAHASEAVGEAAKTRRTALSCLHVLRLRRNGPGIPRRVQVSWG